MWKWAAFFCLKHKATRWSKSVFNCLGVVSPTQIIPYCCCLQEHWCHGCHVSFTYHCKSHVKETHLMFVSYEILHLVFTPPRVKPHQSLREVLAETQQSMTDNWMCIIYCISLLHLNEKVSQLIVFSVCACVFLCWCMYSAVSKGKGYHGHAPTYDIMLTLRQTFLNFFFLMHPVP